MGIHVIQSQRLEVLLNSVMDYISQPSRSAVQIFNTQHFVVPSAAHAQWLKQKMAEQQGMSANEQFHQKIRGFQWYAYQQILKIKNKFKKPIFHVWF